MIENTEVTGTEPSVFGERLLGGLGVLIITGHGVLTAYDNLSDAFGIGVEDLHFHDAFERFTAGVQFGSFAIRGKADERCTLGHTVTDRHRELDAGKKRFHFGVKRRTADDHLLELSTESLHELFPDLGADDLVEEGHFEYPADGRFLDLGHDHLLVNLLEDKRHGEDDGRLDLRKSLEEDLRRRGTSYEPGVSSGRETSQEIECAAVSMCKRQESDVTAVFRNKVMLMRIAYVTGQAVQRHDDTFGETGGTGGIVDGTDLAIGPIVKMQIFGPIAFGMFLFEFRRDGFEVNLLGIERQGDGVPVIEADGCQHLRNLIQIDTLPVDIADEKQFSTGVVNDMDSIVGTEILEDRHDDGTIGDGSQIDSHPVGVIPSHDGDLIVLFNTAFLKKDMQFLDVNGQLAVCQGHFCAVIGNGRQVPMLFKRALKDLDKIIFLFVHHKR